MYQRVWWVAKLKSHLCEDHINKAIGHGSISFRDIGAQFVHGTCDQCQEKKDMVRADAAEQE